MSFLRIYDACSKWYTPSVDVEEVLDLEIYAIQSVMQMYLGHYWVHFKCYLYF